MKVDTRIQQQLPAFLGAPNDWRGCFPPFGSDQVGLFQIGYQPSFAKRWEDGFSQRQLQGVDISSANLLEFADQAAATTLQGYTTTKQPNSEAVLSRFEKGYLNLMAPIMAGLAMNLQAEHMKAADLRATVREIAEVPTNHYAFVDEAFRKVGPEVVRVITRINSGKRPENIYVVVGTERVDFEATVQSKSAVGLGASAAGTEVEAGAGRQTEVMSVTKDRIAVVRLLKYKVEALRRDHANGLAVRADSPSGSDNAGTTESGGTTPNSTTCRATSIYTGTFDSIQDAAGASLDFNDTPLSWTIGERVPLDDDDMVNSGIRTLADAAAIDETLLETEVESSQEDSSSETSTEDEKPVSSMTGKRVALHEEDDGCKSSRHAYDDSPSVRGSAAVMTPDQTTSAAASTNPSLVGPNNLSRSDQLVAQKPPALNQGMSTDLPPEVFHQRRDLIKTCKKLKVRMLSYSVLSSWSSSSSDDAPFVGGGDRATLPETEFDFSQDFSSQTSAESVRGQNAPMLRVPSQLMAGKLVNKREGEDAIKAFQERFGLGDRGNWLDGAEGLEIIQLVARAQQPRDKLQRRERKRTIKQRYDRLARATTHGIELDVLNGIQAHAVASCMHHQNKKDFIEFIRGRTKAKDIVDEIVGTMKANGSRFLRKGWDGQWYELDDAKARVEVSHALREAGDLATLTAASRASQSDELTEAKAHDKVSRARQGNWATHPSELRGESEFVPISVFDVEGHDDEDWQPHQRQEPVLDKTHDRAEEFETAHEEAEAELDDELVSINQV